MSDLLIGGAGFIGAYLSRALISEGGQVAIYDRDVSHGPIRELLRPEELARITLLPGDVTDAVHLLRTIGELRPRRIVHLAAVLTPTGQGDPATAVRVMSLGIAHVLEAVRVLGIERLVWASSVQIFGPLDRYRQRHGIERIVDDSVPDPINIYGACKAHAEFLARHYAQTWGLDITGLRPCGTLGRGRRAGATFEIFELIQRMVRGEAARISRADWVFPLMHVSDVVGAFMAALRRPGRGDGRSYNVGAIPTSMREIAGLLQSMMPDAELDLEGCSTESSAILDAAGIERDLGFRLQDSLAQALAEVVDEARGKAEA